jgi:hypothetical protein
MKSNENNIDYNEQYTSEEKAIIKHLINLEKLALDRWFKGDISGYENLWSKQSFTYFDAVVKERVEDHDTIVKFLKSIEGKLFADNYTFQNPRVQLGKDMAVLTYQLFAKTNLIDMEYNCIEVYQKEADGKWRVIHSTWSFIRPMDKNFEKVKTIV